MSQIDGGHFREVEKSAEVDKKDSALDFTGVVLEKIIFESRKLLVVAYLSISVMLAVFLAKSLVSSFHYIVDIWSGSSEDATVGLLSAIDQIMVANVVFLIAAGSYLVYVKDHLDDITFKTHHNRPQALRHLSPGGLKEKMAASLVGVSSVNLLQILIYVGTNVSGHQDISWKMVGIKVLIHFILILGFIAFAKVNIMEEREDREEEASHNKTNDASAHE